MHIRTIVAAGALALASLGLAPASAQMSPHNGMHQDNHGGPGMAVGHAGGARRLGQCQAGRA